MVSNQAEPTTAGIDAPVQEVETAPAPVEIPRQRVRITYAKGDAIKFVSHHDEFRLWERMLRRADLPLLYKNGFNPQPHIQFASPLSVGFTGAQEFVDITFSPPVPLDELGAVLAEKAPPGITLVGITEVPANAEALQNVLMGADYTILVYAEPDELGSADLAQRIAQIMDMPVIWRERERKGEPYTYNLRPLLFELRYEGCDAGEEEHRIFLRVQQRAGATGRPDEVVDELGLDDFARTLRRDRLYFADDADDAAIFAVYPVVSQAEITAPKGVQGRAVQRGKKSGGGEQRDRGGRTIGERAGDEY
ncbi:MAG: DUF2344 domain-containing protein [Anaerolineales bacterium]|nr:DUF2344 domain-containing protein [Anaerolineales bacterium]